MVEQVGGRWEHSSSFIHLPENRNASLQIVCGTNSNNSHSQPITQNFISGCLNFNLKNTAKNGLLQSSNFTLEIALQVSGTTV